MRNVRVACCVLGFPLWLGAQGAPPVRYFPLDTGRSWTYTNDQFAGETVGSVISRESDQVIYQFRGHRVRLRDGVSAIELDIPGLGFSPYYEFAAASWLHRDFQTCDDNRTLEVTGRDVRVRTPAGVFEDCLEISYRGARCADGGTVREWWAPGVGRVKWEEENIVGLVTYTLESFERGSQEIFRRGDANGTGGIDLTDAIFVLNWLFLGGDPPSCRDAADANDSGAIELSDAVFLLGYLFLGGRLPPPPGPDVCGLDGTPRDNLPECVYTSCDN